ncbi:MAG: FkbM family methyltransferase [Rhodospirillales bacterium]
MNEQPDQQQAIVAAESALDDGDPAKAFELLSPYFQAGLVPRALWLVARVLTRGEQPAQSLDLFKQAFERDPTLPFVEIGVAGKSHSFRDVPESRSLLGFAREFYDDIYGLADLELGGGDVFVDVGANVGFVAISVASRFPDARVIAFEPAPKTFDILKRNLRENGIENVTAINKAVNADGRDLELMVMHGDSGASNAFGSDAVVRRFQSENLGELVRVEATTLDEVFDEYGIARCAVVKLDCEGAEHEILRKTGILERIDRIVMELHIDLSDLENTSTEEFTRAFLADVRGRVGRPPEINVASVVGVRNE